MLTDAQANKLVRDLFYGLNAPSYAKVTGTRGRKIETQRTIIRAASALNVYVKTYIVDGIIYVKRTNKMGATKLADLV